MPKAVSKTGSELFIVDNSEEDWKVVRYLHDWCQISKAIDIASGFFEIGAFVALKEEWQKVDSFRILMGDQVSRRTQKAFLQALGQMRGCLDDSLESEKLKNDFLEGVNAIVGAIKSGKIQCRVYRKDRFHAKCYITHARMDVVGSFALVGSSNFTPCGLQSNVELNVQITGGQVSVLQDWYEKHWNEAEDVTPEVLEVIDRHVKEYLPFDIYAKSLQEFFRGHEMTATEWEQNESKIYPILATYQKQGYHGLLKHAQVYNGAFLCDGVGLGKTFIGLMLIERLIILDRKNVVLFVPKSGRKAVWESKLRQYLPNLFGKYSHLEIFNHTDLMRKGDWQEDLRTVAERADIVIIDEAHNFRNTGTKGSDSEERQSRYWRLFDLIRDKTVFMLTATPVNNQLTDLLHMIELFSRQQQDYFSRLGIHNLKAHFRQMERQIDKAIQGTTIEEGAPAEVNSLDAGRVLGSDALFQELVVQRSRSYVRQSVAQEEGSNVLFPNPKEPKVQPYSVKQTYGKLLDMLEDAFAKKDPLFSLAIYFPLAYYKGKDADKIAAFDRGRQEQVVRLIRTSFLKRFESSVEAFRMSCWRLLKKLLSWAEVHAADPRAHSRIERWKRQNETLLGSSASAEQRLNGLEEDEDSDLLGQADIDAVEKLNPEEFDIDAILDETLLDLDQIVKFLEFLKNFKASQDKKLNALKQLLKKDTVLSKHKVIIFTEFMDTAKYLHRELKDEVSGLEEIDGQNSDRYEVITRFAPYYNGSSSSDLAEDGLEEIRVLISTDVLSEGLNLQDATRLINYDLHWNPVRLMQRIGRIDRRMDPNVEARILADHPEEKKLRGEVGYWNFLPPDELDDLLRLYKTVSKKTLRISKTFGIEGKKLLTPEDDFEELKNFHEAYEGTLSPLESMHLEYQELLKQNPDLEKHLNALPSKVFSGKEHPQPGTRAVFFCYALPAKALVQGDPEDEGEKWSIEAGRVQWYLYDLEKGKEKILEEPTEILSAIRCLPSTPRIVVGPKVKLSEIRAEVDKFIKNDYLKRVQAPIGVKPVLRAWMELN